MYVSSLGLVQAVVISEKTEPEKILSAQSIDASSLSEILIPNGGYSVAIMAVKASYSSSATAGVRVRWLYSPDNTNFDSPEDAEDQGNYEDLTFSPGAERMRTVLVPLLQKYTKVQIVNLDSAVSVTVDVWKTLMR